MGGALYNAVPDTLPTGAVMAIQRRLAGKVGNRSIRQLLYQLLERSSWLARLASMPPQGMQRKGVRATGKHTIYLRLVSRRLAAHAPS